MEDILDLYAAAHDPQYPLVCFDEHPMQLIDHLIQAIPAKHGRKQRYDYHYKRMGTCNPFNAFAPHLGWRHLQLSQQRRIPDFAHQLKWLVDQAFPQAVQIRLVNTHKIASLYKTFSPQEARRIARKLDFHFTPVYGNWLNMAEIELAVLSKQCLNRHLPSLTHIRREISIWQADRNSQQQSVRWLFTCDKARQTMARLYPS